MRVLELWGFLQYPALHAANNIVLCPPAVVTGMDLGSAVPESCINQQRIDGLIQSANPCYHIAQPGGHAHIRHQLNHKRLSLGGWLAGMMIDGYSCYNTP